MEVVVTEEKKKIFRARKTMKISDRQQLESLHSTLLTAAPALSEAPSPPLMNGTHKEDGQKVADKEQNNISDSNSPPATSPASLASLSSPAPFLSLNLSPSPASSQSPKAKDETSPTSPFHSLNFELKKMQDEDDDDEKKGSSPSSPKESVTQASTESKDNKEKDAEMNSEEKKKEAEKTATKDSAVDSAKDSSKDSDPCSSAAPPVTDCTEPMETENDTIKAKDSEASTAKIIDENPSSPKCTTSTFPPCPSSSRPASSSSVDVNQEKKVKLENKEEEKEKEDVKKGSLKNEAKMEVNTVKVETKEIKTEDGKTTKPSRPSSTPPSSTVQEDKGSTSGLKRTLSEGNDKEEQTIKRDGKRPKVEREELEAQLELKITAKAGSHHKLEKIVQQLVDERLRALQATIFDQHFEELKDRVDKIDCANKHQTAINTLQAKIARLAKKFGEANQASENKKKNEALAAAAAAAAAAKAATVTNTPQAQRLVRTSMELKQTPTTVSSSNTAAAPLMSAQLVPTAAQVTTPTSTTMVTQAPILQLITSTSNAVSSLATGITTQSPTGTLLLKTASGSSMMTTGQPLLIQLPLSMANGQAGTLVNIPVSSLSAASSLNKVKTTSTATFILKPAPAITTAPVSVPAAATAPAMQASTGQMSSTQISLARAVYQGGAGGITTPNAGVSVTTARTPAQSVSVAGAMSSASSPATSGPAATGSTAPGPPQGTSLTSKTVVIDMSAMESSPHIKKERTEKNLNTAEALKMFHNLDSDDSDGDGDLSDLGNESDLSWVHETTSSESDSECLPRKKRWLSPAATAQSAQGLPEPALEPTGVLSPPLVSSQLKAAVEKGKDGTVWLVLQPDGLPGSRQMQNGLTEAAGPTAHAKSNVKDALSAFLCLFDDGMLKHIRDCTVAEAHRDRRNSSWDLTVAELKAFIALLYVRGAQCAKNIEFDSMWSEEWGFPFFRQTMARNRFRDIMRFLRFDKKETRRVRLQDDKFALVRATWDQFIQNSIACYKPGINITIAEQLFPTKARCKFTQYMGNKPDKFGIKFWLAADVNSKYMVNGSPYLGKEETQSAGQIVGESVALSLAEPFLGKGRNITTGDFFTSLKLATALQAKNTSLVGTMGKQKRELPPSVKQQAELFSTKVLKCGDATLTVYQGKPRKNVCILSTMHTGVGTFSGAKAKPESLMYHNGTKHGVDVLDQMARAYSVKGGTQRWPVAVFYNILDLAGINAHILFKECTSNKITRRKFLQQLAEELRAEHMEGKAAARQLAQGGPKWMQPMQQAQKRRQCQVRKGCKQNKTSDTCSKCHRHVCGSCARRAAVICIECDQ
ncbi:activating transcription factor 7-interacting protein 1 isoform X2 [Acanthopagrus latus]|uniref:activating transcription factor 7-interacting protein 1 isoform X2 n=1 Tax=Acanthopagrus latus TaxID=8177 RepID=UPI00187BD5F5|nr:activating transcription factor 7-interacting protein 1 isoform X2 [Acanthopagrus latus]